MTLAPGVRFGAYEVVAIIGSGGMGTVYRARDSRLNRDVALKVMSDLFRSDPDRLARFRREAQVLASLNHPNIAAIYGLEEADGVTALVLELVDGPTLADRIERGPIPVDEALPMAKQIADALEVAHEQGIVHRDLKPANIKLRPDGTIKVLDFGLAKAVSNEAASTPSGELSQSPTMTNRGATIAGVILGTAAYMSPEQARGRAVDRRTDIWAFGCVVYEMLTGNPAFSGSDVSEILAAIIKSEPAWTTLPSELPPVVRPLLQRCLQKDPRQRVRDIGDVRLALDGAFESISLQTPSSQRFPARSYVVIVAAVLLIGLGGLAGWSLNRFREQDAPGTARFTIEFPEAARLSRANVIQPVAISPDGRRIFYISEGGRFPQASSRLSSGLYARAVDQLEWTPIKGAEAANASLFVSPDGGWIGFADTSDQTIKKLPLNGSPPATVCKWPGGVFRGASWGVNDVIVFATTAAPGLVQVPAAGGVPAPLTSPQNEIHLTPQFLPGAHAVAFTVRRPGEPDRVGIVSTDTHEQRTLFEGSAPHYVMSGHLVFLRGAALWAAPFDLNRLQVTGEPTPVLQDIAISGGSPMFDLSRDGSLVYAQPLPAEQADRTFVWVDRAGREEPVAAPANSYDWPRLSPDGTRIAVTIDDQDGDIWIWDLRRSGMTRFTSDAAFARDPVWTPDGQRLVFASNREGPVNLFWQAVDGAGPAARLTNTPNLKQPFSVSPDGTRLIFGEQVQRYDIWSLNLKGEPRPEVVLQTRFGDRDADVSPDGRWLAYSSDDSGQFEIYVRSFSDEKRFPISTNGGGGAVWARGGGELFYQAANGAIMAVPVQTANGFSAGSATQVFDGAAYVPSVLGRMYDVSPDGKRFLMLKPTVRSDRSAAPTRLVAVLNWSEELKNRVPVK